MGDGTTNTSQQQSSQQQANQAGWQQQYAGYYNYASIPGQSYQ